MRSHEGVNDRIVREIEKLDINKDGKALLREILQIELEFYDLDKARYTDDYKAAFAKYIGFCPEEKK